DWLVCLKMEWERIWMRSWSPVKFLYLWTRYYSLACFGLNLWLFNSNFTTERCKKLHYIIAASCMWSTLGSELILAFRTYAFLMKSKVVGGILGTMLVGETGYLLYVSIAGVFQTPLLIGTEGPCTATDFPGKHVVSGYWLAPVAFDLICTAMTIGKVVQMRRLSTHPLLKVFVREGLFYFVAVAAVNLLNAAFMFQSNVNIQNINSFLALILSQVLCCRLVLNLRTPSSSLESSGQRSATRNQMPGTAVTTAKSTHNIPLNNLSRLDHASDSDPYDKYDFSGVKVQAEVESDARQGKIYNDV
ncbi:hypothetical protein OF83DRAFT_1059363, partial [Amylostereum chailletii]